LKFNLLNVVNSLFNTNGRMAMLYTESIEMVYIEKKSNFNGLKLKLLKKTLRKSDAVKLKLVFSE
jgi:hypothetical protein